MCQRNVVKLALALQSRAPCLDPKPHCKYLCYIIKLTLVGQHAGLVMNCRELTVQYACLAVQKTGMAVQWAKLLDR